MDPNKYDISVVLPLLVRPAKPTDTPLLTQIERKSSISRAAVPHVISCSWLTRATRRHPSQPREESWLRFGCRGSSNCPQPDLCYPESIRPNGPFFGSYQRHAV